VTLSLALLDSLAHVDWLAHALVGKATKQPGLASVLTEDGFIQEILRESRLIQRQVGQALNSRAVRDGLLASTNINWRGVSLSQRRDAVKAMSNLMAGLPSMFSPSVRGILDTNTNRIVDDVHQKLGARHKVFGVDPVFALKNKQAIAAINDSTSIFFSPEYERQAGRFRARSQDVMQRGLSEGLGSREIGAQLRTEFRNTAINRNYWDTVAAVHVNRARSFSAAATYASNGVTQFEVVAVMDKRTTEVCRMLDGTILSVESALNAFDSMEAAEDLDGVKAATPFMQVRGGTISNQHGTIATRAQGGGWNRVSPAGMNAKGVNMPPFHMRCRTTVVPVMSSASPISPPVGATEAPTPPPLPATSVRPPIATIAPKAPTPKPTDPYNPGPDPISAVGTALEKRKAVLGQIRDGRGLPPGAMHKGPLSAEHRLFGSGSDKQGKVDQFGIETAEAFAKIGRGMIANDKKLRAAWNKAVKIGKDPGTATTFDAFDARANASKEILRVARRLGAKAIPQAERAARKKKFQKDVVAMVKPGKEHLKLFTGAKGKVSAADKKDLRKWAGEAFDSWGPMAEQALMRNRNIYKMPSSVRAHNSDDFRYFGYTDRQAFHHEFAHSIESHAIVPRWHGGSNPSSTRDDSFWSARIKTRDPGPRKQMVGYGPGEKSREDKWASPYMGKDYSDGGSEVVTMFSEMFGGNLSNVSRQIAKDHSAVEEFLGYMVSMINGEVTRQARGGFVGL